MNVTALGANGGQIHLFIAGITVAVKQVFAGHELKQRRRNRACADAAFVRQRCRSQLLP